MVSAPKHLVRKLGENRQLQLRTASGDHAAALLQRNELETFTVQALEKFSAGKHRYLAKYMSILRLAEALRHRNPYCEKTVGGYLYNLARMCRMLNMNPDQLIATAQTMTEERLHGLFMSLDNMWITAKSSPGTRRTYWAILRRFLKTNGVRYLPECDIRNIPAYDDRPPTREECAKLLQSCQTTRERLLVALLIESLQRIGTLSTLTWGDVEDVTGEDVYLVWIDAKRSKCNIAHWMPIGKLSAHFIKKRREELGSNAVPTTPLLAHGKHLSRPLTSRAIGMMCIRIIARAKLRGTRFNLGSQTRYERHGHALRKWGNTEMENNGVNQHVIDFLMGHKTSEYSKWVKRPEDLKTIYARAGPQLTTPDTKQLVVDYARTMGWDLDPETLAKQGKHREIEPSHHCCPACPRIAEAEQKVKSNVPHEYTNILALGSLLFTPPLFSSVSNPVSNSEITLVSNSIFEGGF